MYVARYKTLTCYFIEFEFAPKAVGEKERR